MLVRQEDVTQSGQGHVGEDELSRDAVAAIDDIGCVVADDDLGGPRTRLPRSRSAAGPEKDQPALCGLRLAGARAARGARQRSGAAQESSPVDICPSPSGHSMLVRSDHRSSIQLAAD
jgi:hypothetical protein